MNCLLQVGLVFYKDSKPETWTPSLINAEQNDTDNSAEKVTLTSNNQSINLAEISQKIYGNVYTGYGLFRTAFLPSKSLSFI